MAQGLTKVGLASMQEHKSILQEARGRVELIGRTLGLVREASGWWMIVWAVLLVCTGLIPASIVYLTKFLVDSIAATIAAGATWDNIQVVVVPAAVMGALIVLQQSLGSFASWVNMAQSELVQDRIKSLVHEKAANVHFHFYESAGYFDKLQQANSQASGRTLALIQNIGNLFQSAITFVSIAFILLPYGAAIPLILLLSTLPALYVVVQHNRRHHAWWERNTALQRWAQYFDGIITHQLAAAEIRVLGTGDFLRAKYQHFRARLRVERLQLAKEQAFATLGASAVALIAMGGAMGWMVLRALRGGATLGDLALFYQAFNQGQSLMRTLLSGAGQVYSDTLFLEHLFSFLDQEREDASDAAEPAPFPSRLQRGVTFEGVTFRYPGTRAPVLDNFSMVIPAGKVVAVVGANGAGKSTLIKILCRLYEPEAGRVLVDDVDLRRMSLASLRRSISVMFQHPVRYQATVAENIAMGEEEAGIEAVEVAGRSGGAESFVENLPEGYATQLGRLFEGGTELSGGEWQRIALSRAFLRQAPIVVLDEPTSYMDSWAEADWLRRFRRLVRGQTSLIITHRFTTAMQADLIYVMMEGEIVESGTHEELVEMGGRYAESWKSQVGGVRHEDSFWEGPAEVEEGHGALLAKGPPPLAPPLAPASEAT